MQLSIKVTANAKKPEVKQLEGNLAVRVDAPPEGNKANARLVEILSEHFEIPKSRIRIIKGHKSRNKIVDIG